MDAQVGCPKGGTEDRLSFSQETHWAVQPSPHRARYLCVCVCQDEEGRVGLRGRGGGNNYLCASPAEGGTKVAPAEGLIIRKKAF